MFTNNSKKWRDLGKQLEIPATLFFWGLAVEISFLPMMKSHHVDGDQETKPWENTVNKVLVALLVLAVLNFVAKIFIQLIAIRFHLRTYSDRIDVSKFQIASLTKMYQFSRDRIDLPDSEFEEQDIGSGTRTPRKLVREAQKTTVIAFKKIGDVTGKIAGDFAGRDVATSSHPHQVVLSLLSSNEGSQVIARRLYRTFCRDNNDTVHLDDLRPVFDSDDEADAAFAMFDKDMNGDISMEELEAACVEIGRERKSITASLKDLDSVVAKLDQVFFFIVFIIAILVLVTLISSSGAAVLTSAGSTLLALSWLFSATAQEFLQSIIFVFVKHPFDVGDRVSIYGNTGSTLKGDDYFVKKVSLLYTEFKKMEGQVVQAPNNYLNQLFILNQRRSGALAEAIPLTIKFGTTLEQIDSLRLRLLEFVRSEKREYQPNIVTELRDITDVYSLTLNVVFFYKSNWQNEVLRFQRRNKFICALMVSMQELGIEGPRARIPGQSEAVPFYLQRVQPAAAAEQFPEFARADYERGADPGSDAASGIDRVPSLPGRRAAGRRRGESLAQMGRRMDFSLGTKEVAPSDLTGDVFATRAEPRVPVASPTRGEHGVGRSTSVSVLARGEPESDRSRSRFFGALRSRESDLESGTMAGIPVQARIGSRTSRPSIASAVRPVVSHPVLRERSDE
jgi:small-conductance mechanosensitive channel